MNYTDRLIDKILLENAGEEDLAEKDRIAEEKAREAASKVVMPAAAGELGEIFLKIIELANMKGRLEYEVTQCGKRLEKCEKALYKEIGTKYGIDWTGGEMLEGLKRCGEALKAFKEEYSTITDDFPGAVDMFLANIKCASYDQKSPEEVKKTVVEAVAEDLKNDLTTDVHDTVLEAEYDPEYYDIEGVKKWKSWETL